MSEEIACGVRALGLERGDKAAFFLNSDLYFALCDTGTLIAGIVNVPIYTTNPPETTRYVLEHSESQLLIVADEAFSGWAGERRAVRLRGQGHQDRRAVRGRAGPLPRPDAGRHGAAPPGRPPRQGPRVPRRAPERAARDAGRDGRQGPRDAHLHQRHHRHAQGRHADAREHVVQRDGLLHRLRGHGVRRLRGGAQLPADDARVRPHAAPPAQLRRPHALLLQPRPTRRAPRGGQADHVRHRAARAGEGDGQSRDGHHVGRGRQKDHRRVGARAGPQVRDRHRAGRARPSSSTAWPTSWCTRSCARSWA